MKKILSAALLCLISYSAISQVWFEDFNDETDGATSGTATGSPGGTWSTTCVGCTSGTAIEKVTNGGFEYLEINETGASEGTFTSSVVNISSARDIVIYIETATAFTEVGDYLQVYYKLDGGAETLFHSQTEGLFGSSAGTSPVLNGSTLQIVVRTVATGNADFFSIDNVVMTNTLYSRLTGNWDTSGTWSAISIGGASCACTPTTFTRVVVGGGHTVSIPSASGASNLTVNGTADTGGAGTLQWSGNFDLNIDQAGSITVNSGGQILDGGFANSSISYTDATTHAIVNNGSISIGDINVTNSDLLAVTTINISGTGTFALTDDLTLTETSIASAAINNSATLSIAGTTTIDNTTTFTNTGTVTMSNTAAATLAGSGTWTQGVNGTLNYAGSTITTTTFNASNSGNTVNYNAGAAQTIRNPATSTYANLSISNDNTKTLAAATTITGNLLIQGTAVLDVSASNFNISLAGNWTNTSTNADPFVQRTGTITLNSTTAAQTITNTGDADGTVFNNLTFNNTFGTSPQITINNTASVLGTLTMTSGIINLSGTTFTLGSSGVASILSRTASTTTNWFYGGTFRRFWLNATAVSSTAGNLYGLFPLGTSAASSYRPVAINSTANPTATGSFSVTHTDASTTTDLSPVYDDDPTAGVTNIVRKHNAQFVTSSSGVTGGTYNISATMTGLSAGTLSDIRLAVSNGATTVTNVGTHSAATGTAQNPTATRTGVSLANLSGDFRITTTNSTNTPLPIVLRYFKAMVDENEVKTEWATAQEINNHFFTLQKTADFEKYYDIVVIQGKGNSNEFHSYAFVDKSPFIGKSYYRLKQTDFDGKVTYSEPVMVRYDGPESIQLMAYPNPSNGSQITVELKGIKDTPSVPIHIYNQQGQKISDMILTEDGPGVIHEEIIFNTPLPQGLYILKAGKTLQLTRKIVVN